MTALTEQLNQLADQVRDRLEGLQREVDASPELFLVSAHSEVVAQIVDQFGTEVAVQVLERAATSIRRAVEQRAHLARAAPAGRA